MSTRIAVFFDNEEDMEKAERAVENALEGHEIDCKNLSSLETSDELIISCRTANSYDTEELSDQLSRDLSTYPKFEKTTIN